MAKALCDGVEDLGSRSREQARRADEEACAAPAQNDARAAKDVVRIWSDCCE